MTRLIFTILCAAAVAAPAAAASPDPSKLAVPPEVVSKARALVRQLGSDSFQEREDAQAELAKMGRLARPALVEAVRSDPDPEVRFRCARLLPKAEAEELKLRLEAFLADADGKFEHDLPGWAEFREATGAEWRMLGYRVYADPERSKAAREVYTELLDDATNRGLVMAVGGPQADLGAMVAARKQELYNWRFPRGGFGGGVATSRIATVGDVTALLFAESQVPSRHVPRAMSVSILMSAPGVSAAVTGSGEKSAVYRSVVVRWLDTRSDPSDMYSALGVATNLNLKEGARLAARMLGTPGGPGYYRGQAAMTLVRLGAKEHLPDLEKCFADETAMPARRVAGNAQPVEVQVRDIALAACLMLTDQDPTDYGFVENFRGSSMRTSYMNWSIPPEKRAEAFARWAEWREKNPAAARRKD